MDKNPRTYISFYPDEEAQGGPLRETLVIDREPTHGLTLRAARRKAKELKAKSFVMYKLIPRVWRVESEDEED